MKFEMRFEGGNDLAVALGQLSTRLSRKVQREALQEGAEPMRDRMGDLAPRRPPQPDLADHMVISTARGQDAQEVAVAVGPAQPFFHGSFQELGTAHHAAQPFARPAFDETSRESLRIVGEAMWRELAGRGIARPTVSAPASVIGGPGGSLT